MCVSFTKVSDGGRRYYAYRLEHGFSYPSVSSISDEQDSVLWQITFFI